MLATLAYIFWFKVNHRCVSCYSRYLTRHRTAWHNHRGAARSGATWDDPVIDSGVLAAPPPAEWRLPERLKPKAHWVIFTNNPCDRGKKKNMIWAEITKRFQKMQRVCHRNIDQTGLWKSQNSISFRNPCCSFFWPQIGYHTWSHTQYRLYLKLIRGSPQ